MLNEGTLVLEGVTLAQVVELVVEVLVDLAGGTVADEQATENTHPAHPDDVAEKRNSSATRSFHKIIFIERTISTAGRSVDWIEPAITARGNREREGKRCLHTWAYEPP